MKHYFESLLLVGLLVLALSACSTTKTHPNHVAAPVQKQNVEIERHIASLESVSKIIPDKTIFKKDVEIPGEGIRGDCYILKGGYVRKVNDGMDKKSKIPAEVKFRKKSYSYNEEQIASVITKAFTGERIVTGHVDSPSESPVVKYSVYSKTETGTNVRFLALRNYKGLDLAYNGLSEEELTTVLGVIDAVCK